MSQSRSLPPGLVRSIIIKLHFFGDRQTIFQSVPALRGTGVYINEDYSSETNRKALYPVLKAAHNKAIYKDKLSIYVDRLVLNGKTYTINNLYTLPADLNPAHLATNDCPRTNTIFWKGHPLQQLPSQPLHNRWHQIYK